MIVNAYNYAPMDRETIEGVRHYCLPDGSRVPSVTTILDLTKPEATKEALARWRKNVGEQRAREITTEAANRGTRMHKWLECYIRDGSLGTPGSNPYSRQSHVMASRVVERGLAPNVDEFWGSEVALYYSGLYAGTSDCVAKWRGKPAILDFKQTNRPKKREWIGDYFIQLAAYAEAHDHMFGTKIDQGVILMCSQPTLRSDGTFSDPEYQEFRISGSELDHYRQEWYDRVEQFYSLV